MDEAPKESKKAKTSSIMTPPAYKSRVLNVEIANQDILSLKLTSNKDESMMGAAESCPLPHQVEHHSPPASPSQVEQRPGVSSTPDQQVPPQVEHSSPAAPPSQQGEQNPGMSSTPHQQGNLPLLVSNTSVGNSTGGSVAAVTPDTTKGWSCVCRHLSSSPSHGMY